MKTNNDSPPGRTGRASRRDLRRLARHQVMGLSAQFLFGMAVALIGQPAETTGAAHTASNVLLGAHVLVAAALVAGAVMVIRAAAGGTGQQRQFAHWGAIMIVVTFVTGVLTMITNSSWWSYSMAIGFLASLLLYGALLVQAASPARQPE